MQYPGLASRYDLMYLACLVFVLCVGGSQEGEVRPGLTEVKELDIPPSPLNIFRLKDYLAGLVEEGLDR